MAHFLRWSIFFDFGSKLLNWNMRVLARFNLWEKHYATWDHTIWLDYEPGKNKAPGNIYKWVLRKT